MFARPCCFPAGYTHRAIIWIIAVFGLVIRLLLIICVTWINDSDLKNYFWAGLQAAQGRSPYMLWAQHLTGPRSDVLPLELAPPEFSCLFKQNPTIATHAVSACGRDGSLSC